MIGKKDVSNTLNIGIEQIMHMTYECAEFERITRLNDIEAYEKLCDQMFPDCRNEQSCCKHDTPSPTKYQTVFYFFLFHDMQWHEKQIHTYQQ